VKLDPHDLLEDGRALERIRALLEVLESEEEDSFEVHLEDPFLASLLFSKLFQTLLSHKLSTSPSQKKPKSLKKKPFKK